MAGISEKDLSTRLVRRTALAALAVALVACAGYPVAPATGADTVHETAPATVAAAYIVTARSLDDARSAVRDVDGEITHELGIIDAVGARLTETQRRDVAADSRVVSVQADRKLRTASLPACGVTAGVSYWEDNKFEWTVTNTSVLATARIGAMSIAWPSTNGKLKKVRLDGAELWGEGAEPPYVQLLDWHEDETRRDLAPGQSTTLKFEFDNNIDWNEANYTIYVDFENGCSVEFTPRAMDCRSDGLGQRAFSGNKIQWMLPNLGNDPITLAELALNWPRANGALRKVKLDGGTVFDGVIDAPVATLADVWPDDIRNRRIDAGDVSKLELEFENDVSTDQEAYGITAGFDEQCQAEFVAHESTFDDGPSYGDKRKVDKKARDTHFGHETGADRLHARGIVGSGVTVAILDTGVWGSGGGKNWLRKDPEGNERLLGAYDAIENRDGDYNVVKDENGHGSHVASIVLSSRKSGENGRETWNGVAPGASFVAVKAFDETGSGSYLDVIRGIDWVVTNRDAYGIRVLNLSLAAPVRSHYWDDPLNRAVMKAWQAGIVVVVSAGNTGPDPLTVGVPANVPYVITVGAMTDNGTPFTPSDDRIASFSAAGPTVEGFVKPEIVAPGGRLLGVMDKKHRIPQEYKRFHDGNSYYYMSGTSQSAAVVTGLAALLLDAEPGLTPDEVKCKLFGSARPLIGADGKLAEPLFRQGAGLVDGEAAVDGTRYDCANRGLDIDADLAGERHFGGRVALKSDGSFYLMGTDGYLWSDEGTWANGYLWGDQGSWANGYLWSDEGTWANGYLWTEGYLWTDGRTGVNGYRWTNGSTDVNGYLWTEGFLWADEAAGINGFLWGDEATGTNGFLWGDEAAGTNGFLWGDEARAGINAWVPQE